MNNVTLRKDEHPRLHSYLQAGHPDVIIEVCVN